jgi:hypothetical protein
MAAAERCCHLHPVVMRLKKVDCRLYPRALSVSHQRLLRAKATRAMQLRTVHGGNPAKRERLGLPGSMEV